MRSRLAPAALVSLLLLTACGGSSEPAAEDGAPAASVQPGATLTGVLGEPDDPDAYVIGLTDADGAPVRELPAGDYTIEVADETQIHNWHITGEGVDEGTGVNEVETVTFEVTLEPGEYTYVCDPHPNMVGTVTVV